MTQITSTKLKQQTREILDELDNIRQPLLIMTYNKPRAVIVDYQTWEKMQRKPSRMERLKKLQFRSGSPVDSVKMVREMRDGR